MRRTAAQRAQLTRLIRQNRARRLQRRMHMEGAWDRLCSACGRLDRVVQPPGSPQEGRCIHCHGIYCDACYRRHQLAGAAPPFDPRRPLLTCTVCGRADFAHHCPTGCPGGRFTPLSAPEAVSHA